jgi:hypothetical protein
MELFLSGVTLLAFDPQHAAGNVRATRQFASPAISSRASPGSVARGYPAIGSTFTTRPYGRQMATERRVPPD